MSGYALDASHSSFLARRRIQIACYSKVLFHHRFIHAYLSSISNIIGLSISCHWLFLTVIKNKKAKFPTIIFVTSFPVSCPKSKISDGNAVQSCTISIKPCWRNTLITCFNFTQHHWQKEDNRQIRICLINFCNDMCFSLNSKRHASKRLVPHNQAKDDFIKMLFAAPKHWLTYLLTQKRARSLFRHEYKEQMVCR